MRKRSRDQTVRGLRRRELLVLRRLQRDDALPLNTPPCSRLPHYAGSTAVTTNTTFFNIYKTCVALHRSKLKMFDVNLRQPFRQHVDQLIDADTAEN